MDGGLVDYRVDTPTSTSKSSGSVIKKAHGAAAGDQFLVQPSERVQPKMEAPTTFF